MDANKQYVEPRPLNESFSKVTIPKQKPINVSETYGQWPNGLLLFHRAEQCAQPFQLSCHRNYYNLHLNFSAKLDLIKISNHLFI